ncbi:hypothetical protein C4566_02885 [Candidatus Parcubacteria bacterium]|nr:MAG: hypothetical protein C4566_02885 [Candidatus Parcubacteria bacterium]
MKITICSSLAFSKEAGEVAERLKKAGHEVLLPATTEKILVGLLRVSEVEKEKELGLSADRAIKNNAIINHYNKIKASDAILSLNYEKNGVKNYIGGSVFMEIAFAFVLGKKIFLLNDIPDVSYKDEIIAMQPIIINNDLTKIVL